jgi:MFS family permease
VKKPSATNNVLILLCAMYALTYIDRNNVSTAAAVFTHDLHLSNTQIGLVFSGFAYPYLVFQIIGGWIGDRLGARRTLAISGVIWAGATLLTGMAGSLAFLLFARVLLGFGEGATFPTATRAMSDWVPKERRAFVQGLTHSSARLGNALTPPVVAWLTSAVNWRFSFFALGAISFGWVVAWWRYYRDDPTTHPEITLRELNLLPNYSARMLRSKEPVPWLRLVVRMLPVTAVCFCYGWTLWLYLAWIPAFFLHKYNLNLKNSALFSAGVFFAGVVGNTAGGLASDAIYHRTRNRIRSRRDLIVLGFLASLAFMVPVFWLTNVNAVALCLSAAFFFAEFTIGPLWAIPMDVAPRFAGSASGLMNSGSALAAIISPIVFGYVIDRTGNWDLPFLGSIGLLFCGSLLAFWTKPDRELAGAALPELEIASRAAR